MAKPPPSGPHSDLTGVNRDARVNDPNRDAGKGTAEDKAAAQDGSAATPDGKPPLGK